MKSTSVKSLTNNVQALLSDSESESENSDESDTGKVHKLVPQAQSLANIKADDVYKISPTKMINRWSSDTTVVTRYDGDKSQFIT